MRDYYFTRAISFRYEANGNTGPCYALGADDDDLRKQIGITQQRINVNFAPLPVIYTFPTEAITLYFLLDKASFMKIVGTYQGFGDNFVIDATTNSPTIWSVKVNPAKGQGPRDTWHGNEGLAKKSTQGTPPDLAALLNGLLALAQQFLDAGDYQKGGECIFAHDQVTSGAWTFTRAIDYLRRAGVF